MSSLRRMLGTFFLTSTFLLGTLVLSQPYPQVEAASVTNITLYDFRCYSNLILTKIRVTGNFNIDDGYVGGGGEPIDLIGFRITDGAGNVVLETTFGVAVGGPNSTPA